MLIMIYTTWKHKVFISQDNVNMFFSSCYFINIKFEKLVVSCVNTVVVIITSWVYAANYRQTCYRGHLVPGKTCLIRSLFICPFVVISLHFEPQLKGHLSYKVRFSWSQGWPLYTGLSRWGNGDYIKWSPFKLRTQFIR